MTTTYKGNTIGLNYDAANATWSFTNEPNDFIDPNSFSTADPAFDYTPPPSDDDQDQDDDFNPCPPGYIYDSTLKQCVIDPNQQTNYQQDTSGGQDRPPVKIAGTDRYTTNNNFQASDEEYENMSAEEFVENYKQRGMVGKDENGNLFIDLSKMARKGNILDAIFSRVPKDPVTQEKIRKGDIPRPTTEAEASIRKSLKYIFDKNIAHGDLNQDLFNFKPLGMGTVDSENFPLTKLFEKDKENYKIILPTKQSKSNIISGTTGTEVIGGWGNKIFDTSHGVYDRGADVIPLNRYNETLNKWAKYASLQSNYDNYLKESGIGAIRDEQEKERLRKLKYEADMKAMEKRRKADQIRREAEQQQIDAQKEREERLKKRQKDKEEDTGGSWGGDQDDRPVIQPKKDTKSKAPPGQPETGPHIGYGSGGTSLGSSVHGTGSYNKPKSKSKPKPRPTHHF